MVLWSQVAASPITMYLHAVSSEHFTETHEVENLSFGLDPNLSPLERALVRGVEKDAADTD